MVDASTAAREALSAGFGLGDTLALIDHRASFAGSMRTNLVRMLNDLGLPELLGIPTSAS